MSTRREFSKAVKLAAYQRSGGHCEICTSKLYPGRFDYHHDKEDTFGGEPTLENCVVACVACHSKITRKRAAVIAKSNRVRNREIGIKKPSTFACARTSKFKKKITGEVVLR